MSALLIEKLPGRSKGVRCRTPKCTNTGRFRIRIAGYYVMGEGTLSHQKELLCKKHAEEMEDLWAELLGEPNSIQAAAA